MTILNKTQTHDILFGFWPLFIYFPGLNALHPLCFVSELQNHLHWESTQGYFSELYAFKEYAWQFWHKLVGSFNFRYV